MILVTTDPAEIYLSYSKNVLTNAKSLATVQLLDSVGNPVYAKKDVNVKLVSNDESVLKILPELTIEKGSYFSTIELETFNEGEIELALLSEDFTLSKHTINVVDISPVLSLDLVGGLNWNERIEAKLSIKIPEITTALNGFAVEWEVDGGEVLQFDEVTNSEGIAIMNVLANDKASVTISAVVSGNGLSSSSVTKTANIINFPVIQVETESETGIIETETILDTMTIVYIMIPVAVGVALFMLKRMDKLDMITEKIPIAEKLDLGDKIEEIKEKISDIRNR